MENWIEKYDYPMSEDFWRDAIRLHTGKDPYASDAFQEEILSEIREVKELLKELIIELRELKENRNERQQKPPKKQPVTKSRGVEL